TVTGRRMARTVSHMLRILLNERVGADRERAEDRLGPWQIPTRNARPRVWQAHYQCSPAPATAGLRLLPRPLPVRLDTERVLVPRSVVLHPLGSVWSRLSDARHRQSPAPGHRHRGAPEELPDSVPARPSRSEEHTSELQSPY